MYRCKDCGRLFEEPHSWSEIVGSYMGSPAEMSFSESPCCGGCYEEVRTHCEDCAQFGKCGIEWPDDYCEEFEEENEEE